MLRSIVSYLPLIMLSTVLHADQSQDLNSVLQNARMSNGAVENQPGEPSQSKRVQKLGFKKMDAIKTVNGEQVYSPQKAMELYNQMKADDVAVVERQPTTDGAEVKNLDDIMAKARPDERNDLGKLLQQFRIVPVKDAKTSKSLFKVVWVETGSVFEREGLKAGDLVTSNNSSH